MIENQFKYQSACPDCASSEMDCPKNIEQIGKSVRHIMRVGRGKDRTDYTFYQCADCGSVWMSIEDSGAGGHGLSYKRLTKNYI